jgi:hypothetical protein
VGAAEGDCFAFVDNRGDDGVKRERHLCGPFVEFPARIGFAFRFEGPFRRLGVRPCGTAAGGREECHGQNGAHRRDGRKDACMRQ